MKSVFTLLLAIVISISIFSQAPQKMSYQAVIRNGSDQIVASSSIGMQISILQGSAEGTVVYTETQTPTTNTNGLVSIEIGIGTPVIGTFAGIDWSTGTYFIKTETDPDGGTSYNITGTSQLLSVPYALHAKTAQNGFIHYIGESMYEGIIFYIYRGSDGQEHGLIVSKTETTASWSGSTLTGADRVEDGAYNMNLMSTGEGTARTWVEALGAGWYLPSIDELSLLWHSRYHINKTARTISSTLLSTYVSYWSSTEESAAEAFGFDFFSGNTDSYAKTEDFNIRAIRAF